MKLSINQKNLQRILESANDKKATVFSGEVKDETLYLQDTCSGVNDLFWSLAKCLEGKSTGYVEYTKKGIILHGVANKQDYEVKLV